MLIACLILVKLSISQITTTELPNLQMSTFASPNVTEKITLSNEKNFVLTRTILNSKECQLTIYYEFENEGLISLETETEDKNLWSSVKYVGPGNPLLLMTRRVESTLKKETVFMDLCREGLWKEKRGLSEIVKMWNIVDWDKGYLKLWNMNVYSSVFLKFSDPRALSLKDFNLNLFNENIFKSSEEKPIDFNLPLVDRDQFSKQVFGLIEEALTQDYRLLYKLNSKAYDQPEFLKSESYTKTIFDNLMPYVSKFFGFALNDPPKTKSKPVNIMSLKLDIDHILNLMKSELLNRDELFENSEEMHRRHHKEFIPMTSNKLFILSQMIWKLNDIDPYHQFNHLVEPQLESLIEMLKSNEINAKKFQMLFTEIFIIYYSQIIGGFDNIGKPSPYLEFISEYLSKIYNRIKTDMNNLVDIVTQDKTHIMSKIQGNMIKVYNFLESNEPILIPNLPRFVRSAENLAMNFLKEYSNANDTEKQRILSSLYLLQDMKGGSRRISRVKFNPFVLANKKNVLF